MFGNCQLFNQNISNWNVSSVTSMKFAFYSTPLFNQNISKWDVSNVNDTSSMFYICDNFNQNIGSWNVSNVQNMRYMFSGCTSFNQNIGSWNVSNVQNMKVMFNNCILFNQNIGNWNVSKVVNMVTNMFYNCTSFNQNISNWNVSNVTSMQSMFQNTPFNQDISNWNISRVSNQNNTIFINNTAICKKKVPSKLQNNISRNCAVPDCIGGFERNGQFFKGSSSNDLCGSFKNDEKGCGKYCTWIPDLNSQNVKLTVYDYDHLLNLIQYCNSQTNRTWRIN